MNVWENGIFSSLYLYELLFGLLWLMCFLMYLKTLYATLKSTKQDDVPVLDQRVYELSKVSILIPCRNEAKNISKCIQSITNQNSLYLVEEILVLNDHSDDETKKLVECMTHPLINLIDLPYDKRGKKAAISLGVEIAAAPIVVVTDADCVFHKDWIQTISETYSKQKNTNFTTGLVLTEGYSTLLQRFQALDFMANMAITSFGIQNNLFFLANGANMSFRKDVFFQAGGYGGNTHIASGDDVFLAKKMAGLNQNSVVFINDMKGSVVTSPENSWKTFWQQRKRWATKSKAYATKRLFGFQAVTFFLALGIIISFFYGICWNFAWLLIFFMMFLAKFLVDYFFLKQLSKQQSAQDALRLFPVSFIVYQVYIVFMGFFALFSKRYQWKGRIME